MREGWIEDEYIILFEEGEAAAIADVFESIESLWLRVKQGPVKQVNPIPPPGGGAVKKAMLEETEVAFAVPDPLMLAPSMSPSIPSTKLLHCFCAPKKPPNNQPFCFVEGTASLRTFTTVWGD